jgi:tetratricopeptide (TPR) repeat protein
MSAISSFDREFTEVRELVLSGAPDADTRAARLLELAEGVSTRAELIAALAAANRDTQAASARVEHAVERARALPSLDSETMLDLALALLVVNRPSEAADVVFEGLRGGAAEAVSPTLLMAFIDQLLGDQRRSEAEALLRTVYDRLIAPERTPAVPGGPPPRTPARRRRFLEDALRLIDVRVRDRDDATLLTVRAGVLVGLGRLDEAVQSVTRALAARPNDSLARSLLVAALARQRHFAAAVEELKRLPPERLTEPGAVARQVDLLVQAGASEEAVGVAEGAVGSAGDHVEVRIAHVKALAAAGHLSDAELHVRRLASENPERADLAVVQAEVLAAEGRRSDAVRVLQQAVEEHPDAVDPLAALSRLLTDSGELPQALAAAERAFELDPGRADVIEQRARLLMELDRAVEALEVIDSADAGRDSAALHGEILVRLDRLDEALPWYLSALSGAPGPAAEAELAGTLETVCERLFERGDFGEALNGLEGLRAKAPLTVAGCALRAELLRLHARLRESIEQADEALAGGFEEPWLAATKAQALVELSRSADALATLAPVLERSPDYHFGWSTHAAALDHLDAVTLALEALDAHFPLDEPPSGWEDWATMAHAMALIDLGHARDALALLDDAIEERGRQPEFTGPLGIARNRLGTPDLAAAALQETLDWYTGDANGWVMIELADALVARDGTVTRGAKALYERMTEIGSAANGGEAPPPKARHDVAWSHLRLGRPEEAAEQWNLGTGEAADPMLDEKVLYAAALELCGRSGQAQAQLEGVLDDVASLPDRTRAAAILREARYRLGLLDGVDRLRAQVTEGDEDVLH